MRYAARHGAVAVNPVREVGTNRESAPAATPSALGRRTRGVADVVRRARRQNWDLPDLTRMMSRRVPDRRVSRDRLDEVDLDAATLDVWWRLCGGPVLGCCGCPPTKSGRKGER